MSLPTWINQGKVTYGIFLLLFAVLFMWVRSRVMSGQMKIDLKRLVFFDALEEAIGRATEMNRPIIVQTGGFEVGSSQTHAIIAAMSLVNYVARRCAELGTRYFTLSANITHLPLSIEAARAAYAEAGKLDVFEANQEEIARYTTGQHTLATYFREKPAAVFMAGGFGNTSVWYGEGCARVGAISLGGTPRLVQAPFVVVCYDYPLIGEENIVVHAYISRDPMSLSTIAVQDYWKVACIALMVIGLLTAAAGSDIISRILKFQL
jgi:hypothetical protein